MSAKYLIQIHKSKLEDYIAKAIIAPDRYFTNEIEIDTQSQNPNTLIVSDGYISTLNSNQILIALTLTPIEIDSLIEITPHIYRLNTPLPITRIKQIYTQSRDISNAIIDSLISKQSGYISKSLFRVFPKGKNRFKQYTLKAISQEFFDYEKNMMRYDSIMGLFAFIKNTHLYYTNTTQKYITYPQSYFDILDIETKSIKLDEWLESRLSYSRDILSKRLIDRIYQGGYINEKFIEEIIPLIEDEEIKDRFQKLIETSLEYKSILKELQEEREIYYLICLIFIYSKKGSNDRYVLKENIVEEVPHNIAELSLAILGLYYGYTIIGAYEDISFDDALFDKIQDNYSMKFRLDSKLEYILIEAIYKRAFDLEYSIDIEPPVKHKNITITRTKKINRLYSIQKDRYLDVDLISVEF